MLDIRVLTPDDDLQAVGELYAESWKQAYQRLLPQRFLDKLTHDRWTALLRADPSASLGMYENGMLIGTAMLLPREVFAVPGIDQTLGGEYHRLQTA